MSQKPDLKVDIAGLDLQNPVLTASGTFGYAREFERLVDLNRLEGKHGSVGTTQAPSLWNAV